ncbi:Imm1 family immunity protein [Actinokineospora sp. UTMC 2448]|uniref:Imm1 family immunity protein n=1 Tax=Actinokineospora sp. UTMC 2448 TaxID=2268449 RepID=UPI0021641266|nr:Imm1 family immunity protein [Actinokineospora sp. UTMC 2448]UVS80942.1 hypothetical protein Actkin_04694 [Actinokineospora sp. UTMC 2448]
MVRPRAIGSTDQEGDHIAATPDAVDEALDHLASLVHDGGLVAEVTRQGDDVTTLYVGINGEVGALCFTDTDAAHYSQGTPSASGEVLSYAMQQNEMELPPDAELPISDVRAAVHEYANTGTRPVGIRWQRWRAPETPGSAVADPSDASIWG